MKEKSERNIKDLENLSILHTMNLMEMDFFQLKGRDLQELSLIDKINLITKCGSRVNIKLTDEEQVFLDWSEKCDTWEEVVECATAIYEWSKRK